MYIKYKCGFNGVKCSLAVVIINCYCSYCTTALSLKDHPRNHFIKLEIGLLPACLADSTLTFAHVTVNHKNIILLYLSESN